MNKAFIIIAIVAVLGAGIFLLTRSQPNQEITTSQTVSTDSSPSAQQMSDILAGKSSPLYDFSKAKYDEALASDKLVVLYFYANWCPICRAEIPKMYDAFNELTTDKVVGFRVNFNDSDTDSDEENLAKEYGIAYQHTKVFIKNGQRILKSPESWDKQRYLEEINNQVSK